MNKSDLVLLREFGVVFKILNAAILGVISLTSKKENDGKYQFECLTQSQVKQVNPDESSPGLYNQADMGLVGRSRLATSSSLSVVPL